MGITFYDPYQQQRSSENMWQNLMGNMILQKISQNFKDKELEIAAKQHEQDTMLNLQAKGWGTAPDIPEGGPTTESAEEIKNTPSISYGGKNFYPQKPKATPITIDGRTIGVAVLHGTEMKILGPKDLAAERGDMPTMDKIWAKFAVDQINSGVPIDQVLSRVTEMKKEGSTQLLGYDDNGEMIFGKTGPGNAMQAFNANGEPHTGPVTPKGAGPVPSEQSDAIEKLNTLRTDYKVVKDIWTKDYGKAKDWVGPYDAAKAYVVEKTPYADQERSYFHSNVEGVKNQLVYLRSGKQINEQEYQRLMKELPNVSDREEVFSAKIDKFDNELSSIINTKSKMIGAGKYRGAEKVQEIIKGGKFGTPRANPAYQRKIPELIKQGMSVERIKNYLTEKGENPDLYLFR